MSPDVKLMSSSPSEKLIVLVDAASAAHVVFIVVPTAEAEDADTKVKASAPATIVGIKRIFSPKS
tara:strand:+ start:2343 stop:2537 length:195 start_codon:yes stop_codon:yes gene_type:complete